MKAAEFDYTYNDIGRTISFNEEWCNGTGYFDKATVMVQLEIGERAKSIDPYGRKIIFTGTQFGTCVVFERFRRADGADANKTIVVQRNLPRFIGRLYPTSGSLNSDVFHTLCGSADNNIGHILSSNKRAA